jgi:hypothetical protein
VFKQLHFSALLTLFDYYMRLTRREALAPVIMKMFRMSNRHGTLYLDVRWRHSATRLCSQTGGGFRLFVFAPAAELNDRIKASLIHSFLDHRLKYEAVLYR